MKDKNLPDDIKTKSLTELTEIINELVANLENQKELGNSMQDYQKLVALNNFIQKKFQQTSKQISDETRDKISKIFKK